MFFGKQERFLYSKIISCSSHEENKEKQKTFVLKSKKIYTRPAYAAGPQEHINITGCVHHLVLVPAHSKAHPSFRVSGSLRKWK